MCLSKRPKQQLHPKDERKRDESPPARIVGRRTPEATSRLEQTKFRQSVGPERRRSQDRTGGSRVVNAGMQTSASGGNADMYSGLYDGVSGPLYKGVNGGLGGAPTGGTYAGVYGMTYGGNIGQDGGVGGNSSGFTGP